MYIACVIPSFDDGENKPSYNVSVNIYYPRIRHTLIIVWLRSYFEIITTLDKSLLLLFKSTYGAMFICYFNVFDIFQCTKRNKL